MIHLSNGIVAMCFRVSKEDEVFSILSKKGQRVNLLGEVNINKWQGQKTIQFIVEDVMLSN